MSTELIISIISLLATSIIGAFTIIANIKISKISNLKDVHEYQKEITNFELQFKDERWIAAILENGEFNKYSKRSKKKIFKWWNKYKKKYNTILLNPVIPYDKLGANGMVADKTIEELLENRDKPNNDF